ncbi:hypothetical protein FHW69_000844 [Luteibacter sp. Sphag1AF]|uniref:hypothetical protein n=1 Tax=Luteibacter sp. Sphag1AF TaxID=2587031 RepID=UPI001611C5DF|nr:hypothetical protein [Luteibacter sp. Sphag1AF]MBB3226254.1 hypothetical protein [Luteibacter sp. Sphag1AF]
MRLPTTKHHARHAKDDGELVIESELDVGLRFPGDVPGKMYVATWQGQHAVVTRSGDHLDISVPAAEGVVVTGFDNESDVPHHVDTSLTFDKGQRQTTAPPASPSTSRAMNPRASSLPQITFWMFLHDDVLDVDRQHIHARYVAWWIADLAKVLPSHRLWAIYSQQIAGVTDIPYGHTLALQDWTDAIDSWNTRERTPRPSATLDFKFMLITRDRTAPGTSGQAWQGGEQAMASLNGRYSVIAHEFGHTLAAVHDDAEVRYASGWPCETNMIPVTSVLRANCYRYSAKNERNMRVHVAREWTIPSIPHLPDEPKYIIMDAKSPASD